MTALLLLLSSVPQVGLSQSELSAEQAVAKARARAVSLGFPVQNVPGEAGRADPITGPEWAVAFPATGGISDPRLIIEIDRRSGRLKGLLDTTFRGKGLTRWTPRIARVQARARTIEFARTLGFPREWVVGRTAFDGTGKNRWPEEAHATFEERPLGYRYLVEGNRATVRLNPRTGALVGYNLVDDFKFERSAIRLRPDQATKAARKWRLTNRSDPHPRNEGGPRLGWAPILPGSRTVRLVYEVPFRIETHWVDVTTGKVMNGRRTKVVPPLR